MLFESHMWFVFILNYWVSPVIINRNVWQQEKRPPRAPKTYPEDCGDSRAKRYPCVRRFSLYANKIRTGEGLTLRSGIFIQLNFFVGFALLLPE